MISLPAIRGNGKCRDTDHPDERFRPKNRHSFCGLCNVLYARTAKEVSRFPANPGFLTVRSEFLAGVSFAGFNTYRQVVLTAVVTSGIFIGPAPLYDDSYVTATVNFQKWTQV